MNTRFSYVAIAIGVISHSAHGAGEILVQEWNSSGMTPHSYDNGANIVIPVAGSTYRVNVRRNDGAPAATDVGSIAFSGTPASEFELVLSSGVIDYDDVDQEFTAGFRNWSGIAASVSPSLANKIRLAGHISGSLNGPVSVGRIYHVRIDGAINSLLAANQSGIGFFHVHAGSGSSDTVIQRESGNIYGVIIGSGTSGDYLGIIRAKNGDVTTSINVAGDCLCDIEIGETASSPVGILTELTVGKWLGTSSSPAFVGARERVQNVKAGEIHATITGPPGRPRTNSLHKIETTGLNGTSGALAGSIKTGVALKLAAVLGEIKTAGPMQARIDISTGLTTDQFKVTLPANGLVGQILMDVEGGAADLWTGPVKVGTTTLAPPHYSNTAASLGGGTVGLAPFTLHGDDSDPPTGSSIPLANTPGPTNPIRIRHYGPITYDTDEVPVLIEALIDGGTPYDRSSCLIPGAANVEIDSANDTILVVTPEIPLHNGFTYRIQPNVEEDAIDSLYCDIHSNDPVAAWVYEICVGDAHPADINLSGVVDTGDFSLLAGNMGNSGCFLAGDLDANGTVDTSDFNILAANWGDGAGEDVIAACGTESLLGGGEGGMDEIEAALERMGFESLEDFSALLEELSEKEQLDVLVELISQLGE